MPKRLLAISYRFPPQTYPLTTRLRFFLEHLSNSYDIDVITAAPNGALDGVTVHRIPDPSPDRFLNALRGTRFGRLVDMSIWPDSFVFWIIPAIRKARQIIDNKQIDAIAVFMMPYSPGIAGVLLKKWTGLPLILNFNDSPTCSDTNASFPSSLHYHLAHWMEDWYIRHADSVIYVSKHNMERVQARQPDKHRSKFHLVRRGAVNPGHDTHPAQTEEPVFRIVYTGGMSGWYWFIDQSSSSSPRFLSTLRRRIQHQVTELDGRSHSPVYIGQAIKQVLSRHPEWDGRIKVELIGNNVDRSIVNQVLRKFSLQDIVYVYDPVPHEEAIKRAANGTLLFMALPDRPDGSPGGRISAKTYEYLMTNRPILAALPPGENREYLEGQPGVHLSGPKDTDNMARIIEQLAGSFFSGQSLRTDRADAWARIDSTRRAEAFENIVRTVTA